MLLLTSLCFWYILVMSYILSMFIEATATDSTSGDEIVTKQDCVDMIAQLRAELGIHL